MFRLICLFALTTAACAASIGSVNSSTTEKKPIVPVVNFESDKNPDGSFRFTYEGGDKSFREESGVIENAGTDDEALEITGSYRYIDADGQEIEVHYTAGRNGFVPIGTNIAPSISALAKAAADFRDSSGDGEKTVRKARSKEVEKVVKVEKVDQPKPVEVKVEKVKIVEKVEKPETPKVVPVIVQKVEEVKKVEKVATVEKTEKVDKVDSVAKVDKVDEVAKLPEPVTTNKAATEEKKI